MIDASYASVNEVSPAIPATALLVDLRNFTPNLNAARQDERGVNFFCRFLSEFYAVCLDACLAALPPGLRRDPPLYMSSTGDGVLVLFTHPSHIRHGYLAAVLLHRALRAKCDAYNAGRESSSCPSTSFGIGLESGAVSRIRAYSNGTASHPIVDTYIGPCINVAARAEAMTKLFHRAHTIIAEAANDLLCRELFGESYGDLIGRAWDSSIADDRRLAVHDRMNDLNRKLCLTFLHHHNLKGVDRPTALFRIADSTAYVGNPRFDALLDRLTDGPHHLAEITAFLGGTAGAGPGAEDVPAARP